MTTKKSTFTALLAAALLFSPAVLADRNAVADDGREILLKDDGTWEYRSSDRFATGEDGTRVRLQEDGRWEYIGNAPLTRDEQVRTSDLDITLGDVVTETYSEKRLKSTRYDSQTVFNLSVDIAPISEPVRPRLAHFNLFRVTDSRGKEYPVLAVTPQPSELQPGTSFQFSVRVDGSPTGLLSVGTRFIELSIDKAVFGTQGDLKFSKRVGDLIEQKVDVPFD